MVPQHTVHEKASNMWKCTQSRHTGIRSWAHGAPLCLRRFRRAIFLLAFSLVCVSRSDGLILALSSSKETKTRRTKAFCFGDFDLHLPC